MARKIPLGAIDDAKYLKQWREGNELYMNAMFEEVCRRKWGREVFESAKRVVPAVRKGVR